MNHKSCTIAFDGTGAVVLMLAVALSGAFVQLLARGLPNRVRN